ncbi:DUF2569 domain-containing protein [Bradyrhizobium sp. USDA 3650]
MSELWSYAEGGNTRGPLSLSELLPLLSRVADPRRVMIWRSGFDEWKAAENVREVAQQLFRPPPLKPATSSSPPTSAEAAVRMPVVGAEEAAAFKNVKPELTGIGGWLGLVAFGQVVGLLRLLVSLGQYYTSIDEQIWKQFPTAMWGEAFLNAVFVSLVICTIVLFFQYSRHFPRAFVLQMITVICMPLLDALWVAFIIGATTGQSLGSSFHLDEKDGGQLIVAVISALIWIPYVMRSRRVANTFTK